jgi:glycogen synthase
MSAWRNVGLWQQIQRNGMRRSFAWSESAARYLEVYQRAIDSA